MVANVAGHHFYLIVLNPFVFQPEKRCFYSVQGVDDSLINVTTMIPASPSVFLGGIFRGAQSTILMWKGEELFFVDACLTTLVWWLAMSWCLHTSQEARVSGSQAPGSIKAGGSHSHYWANSEGGPSRGFPLAAIFGVAAGLFSV